MLRKINLKYFTIILISAFLMCGIFIKFHLITDIYWDISMGYVEFSKISISDGRLIQFLLLNLGNILHIPMPVYFVAVNIISIFIYSITIYILFEYLLNLKKDSSKFEKYLLLIGSFLTVLNPMVIEHFAYTENIVMSLSMLLGTLAAMAINENKFIKSMLLILFAAISYQGTICFFVIIAVLLILLKNEKGKFIKKFLFIIIDCIIAVLATFAIILIANNILGQPAKRFEEGSGYSLHNIIKMIWQTLFLIRRMDVFCFYLHPRFYVFIAIALTIILFALQGKMIDIIKYIALALLAIILCIMPSAMLGNISISARQSASIGAMVGISIIYLIFLSKRNKYYDIALSILSIMAIAINFYSFWHIGIINQKTNELDAIYGKQICDVITKYEEDNNIKIEKVAFCSDKNFTKTYNNYKTTMFTTKGILPKYSNKAFVEYFLNRKLEKYYMSRSTYDKYFAGKDWNEFSEEQIKFEGNIAYICVY